MARVLIKNSKTGGRSDFAVKMQNVGDVFFAGRMTRVRRKDLAVSMVKRDLN